MIPRTNRICVSIFSWRFSRTVTPKRGSPKRTKTGTKKTSPDYTSTFCFLWRTKVRAGVLGDQGSTAPCSTALWARGAVWPLLGAARVPVAIGAWGADEVVSVSVLATMTTMARADIATTTGIGAAPKRSALPVFALQRTWLRVPPDPTAPHRQERALFRVTCAGTAHLLAGSTSEESSESKCHREGSHRQQMCA